MPLTTNQKQDALRALAKKRQQADTIRLFGTQYSNVRDFHEGIYECDYVSPWSKCAHNVNATVMIVGQDWSSEDALRGPVIAHSITHGYDPNNRTNINLQRLLREHLGKEIANVYATNAFPFIKPGPLNAPIPPAHLRRAVEEFLLPQIKIIEPQIVVCLGKSVFCAFRRTCGHGVPQTLDDAIKTPFEYCFSRIVAVAHTVVLGTINRGKDKVEKDWASMRVLLDGVGLSDSKTQRR